MDRSTSNVDIERQISSAEQSGQGSFVHRHSNGSIIVEAVLKNKDAPEIDRWRKICGCWSSGNMRVLFVTAALFTTITIAQTIAAKIAKSDALVADCVSMAVDALTYGLNIFVEAVKGKSCHRPAQLTVPAISIGLLTYFTIAVIKEAVPNLQNTDAGDDVNPWIVFAFAVWGILFDVLSMLVFWRNLRKSGSGSGLGINMMAAFLHVGADFARSMTTFIESILILGFGFNGTVTDAWACILVSATILVGAAYAAFEWLLDARKGCTTEQSLMDARTSLQPVP